MTAKQQSANEAIERLRETLKPGDTVYTVLRHVSRSGMSRLIDLYKMSDGEPQWLSRLAARAAGFTFDEKKECIRVGGCGMDMGFHLVYNLSRVLYRDAFECIGDKCPSNDHNNAYYHEKQGECIVCQKPVGKFKRPDGHYEYSVCSVECATGPWLHSDAGYALRQRWM